MIKPGERQIQSQVTFTDREELIDWVKQNQKPLWAELTFSNLYYVWQGSKITFVAFVKNVEEHLSKTILSTFKSIAKTYGPVNDISFVIVDTNIYKDFSQGLGLNDEDIPTFAIFDPLRRKEHFFPKDQYTINLKHSKRWIERYISGKLDTPEEIFSPEDAVVKITSDNFADVVYDTAKDVLVEFYAPWCGHCTAFAPVYKSIATIMRLLPSVVISAQDVQASLPPEKYNITSLPTILYFPANDKDNAIPYGGAKDMNSLVEFLLEHQTSADETAVNQFKKIFSQFQEQQQQQQLTDEEEVDEEGIDLDIDEDNKEEL